MRNCPVVTNCDTYDDTVFQAEITVVAFCFAVFIITVMNGCITDISCFKSDS